MTGAMAVGGSSLLAQNRHRFAWRLCLLFGAKRTSRLAAFIARAVYVASMPTNRVGGIASDSILANQSFDAQQGLPGVKIRRWQIWTG